MRICCRCSIRCWSTWRGCVGVCSSGRCSVGGCCRGTVAREGNGTDSFFAELCLKEEEKASETCGRVRCPVGVRFILEAVSEFRSRNVV